MTSLQLPLQVHVRLVEVELGWVLLRREAIYPPQGEAAGDNGVMGDAAWLTSQLAEFGVTLSPGHARNWLRSRGYHGLTPQW